MRGGGEKRLYEFRLMYNAYQKLSEQVLPFVLKFSKKDILRLLTAISDKTGYTTILRSATAISSPTTIATTGLCLARRELPFFVRIIVEPAIKMK